jgi:hypothetical protein
VAASGRRTRLFIDFWNFQLSWQERSGGVQCDWRVFAPQIIAASSALLATGGISDPMELEETHLYASVDPVSEANLRKWLDTFVNRLPGWQVNVRERRAQPRKVHCRNCGKDATACPNCSQPYVAKPEKGVDTAIVTDLLSLAWQDAYDVAILLSSDADFVPAVERIQAKGLKVVNAAWRAKGHELKAACWGSFEIDSLVGSMGR